MKTTPPKKVRIKEHTAKEDVHQGPHADQWDRGGKVRSDPDNENSRLEKLGFSPNPQYCYEGSRTHRAAENFKRKGKECVKVLNREHKWCHLGQLLQDKVVAHESAYDLHLELLVMLMKNVSALKSSSLVFLCIQVKIGIQMIALRRKLQIWECLTVLFLVKLKRPQLQLLPLESDVVDALSRMLRPKIQIRPRTFSQLCTES